MKRGVGKELAMHEAKQDQEKNTKKSKKRVSVEAPVEELASVPTSHLKKRRRALKALLSNPMSKDPPRYRSKTRLTFVRDDARAFVGIFVEFPSYFDIPINSTLCLGFQFVQKFRGQSEASLGLRKV